jgi:hypothetical protein
MSCAKVYKKCLTVDIVEFIKPPQMYFKQKESESFLRNIDFISRKNIPGTWIYKFTFTIFRYTGVPELRKSSITCLLLEISTVSFFLDDSCVSTAH